MGRTGHLCRMLSISDLQVLNATSHPPPPPQTPGIVIIKNSSYTHFQMPPIAGAPPLRLPLAQAQGSMCKCTGQTPCRAVGCTGCRAESSRCCNCQASWGAASRLLSLTLPVLTEGGTVWGRAAQSSQAPCPGPLTSPYSHSSHSGHSSRLSSHLFLCSSQGKGFCPPALPPRRVGTKSVTPGTLGHSETRIILIHSERPRGQKSA